MPDSPLRERWQPVRGGLINLFKYENQVFRYENGRLLLRGNNGSGKSRVLALQLPFLFDGEMASHRVEPDRDPAKKMEWHLLMDRHERRSGYTWIEFGRLENGEATYLTLGCGMEARKGGGSPNRWFFITSRRVGLDLQLIESRMPLTKRQLNDAFEGGTGIVYERAGEYRSAVDDALFKLGTRYGPLLDLLIQLRQPQLMRDMKEDVLSNALSEALPPVGESILKEVAESFEGLDNDRQRTEGVREMLETVDSFREGYRQYLAVAVRRLCEVVRLGHSQFESANRALRESEQSLAETRDALASAQSREREAATRLAAVETEIQTLRDSPEMRSKRELEAAEQRARDCEREAAAAKRELASATEAHARASAEGVEREAKVAACRADTERKHRALTSVYQIVTFDEAPLFAWENAELEKERDNIEDLISRRKKGVRHLEGRNAEVGESQRAHQRDCEQRDQRLAAVAELEDKAGAAEVTLEAEIGAFGKAVARWFSTLVILKFPADRDWEEKLSGWLAAREGAFVFQSELTRTRNLAQAEIADARAELANRAKTLDAERAVVAMELEELRSGRQPEPPQPHTRDEREPERPGAPFWMCFDFREEIPVRERAGWEAALESSGLLDAWIFPDGTMAAPTDDDFLLPVTGIPVEKSLAAVLHATDQSELLTRLLHGIGNHRDSAPCWVDRDGHWANGPRRGHWHKSDACYLGHRAREESRARRISELELLIGESEEKRAELSARDAELVGDTQMLETEVVAAPDEGSAREVAIRLEQFRETLQENRNRHLEAEKRAVASGELWQRCLARRDADARDMGLAEWAAPEKLADFEEKLDTFKVRTLTFWPAWESFLGAVGEWDRAKEREAAADATGDTRRQQHEARELEARRERARVETLMASVGATVQELMARLAGAESRAVTIRAEGEAAAREIKTAELEEATLVERHRNATEKRGSEESRRNHAVARMEVFATEQLFAEVEPDYQPDRVDFSATAAVDLARRIEQELRSHRHDDAHWNKLQSEMTQRFNELTDQLGRHGHHPQLRSVDESSVHVIRCEYRGESRSIRQLRDLVGTELQNFQRMFEEREREVIENHLIGEAADELQKRIRHGEDWVVSVNEELKKVTTSSGLRLKFDWNIATPDDETLKSVRALFLKTSAAWTPRERVAIGQFLHRRIRAVREEDDSVGWREHLGRALDYRAWHRFGILRREGGDGAWKKLTKQTFGTGSGGEKAMTLTVPQFAAAAAHYKSAHPHAPRLILLDEVFVGIDSGTRTKLMGLLETFDLDYVMTSEREWGVYPTVSALAIYQLATRKDLNAIAVTRWVWNGREKLRDDTDE